MCGPKGCKIDPRSFVAENKLFEKERPGSEVEAELVENDLTCFEDFISPPGNYHCTCLFMGGKIKSNQKHIYNEWKDGIKMPLAVEFIVYVPGYLMTGFIKKESLGKIECANELSHMTMLLKNGAKAVESNEVLELLNKADPAVFKGI